MLVPRVSIREEEAKGRTAMAVVSQAEVWSAPLNSPEKSQR